MLFEIIDNCAIITREPMDLVSADEIIVSASNSLDCEMLEFDESCLGNFGMGYTIWVYYDCDTYEVRFTSYEVNQLASEGKLKIELMPNTVEFDVRQ